MHACSSTGAIRHVLLARDCLHAPPQLVHRCTQALVDPAQGWIYIIAATVSLFRVFPVLFLCSRSPPLPSPPSFFCVPLGFVLSRLVQHCCPVPLSTKRTESYIGVGYLHHTCSVNLKRNLDWRRASCRACRVFDRETRLVSRKACFSFDPA